MPKHAATKKGTAMFLPYLKMYAALVGSIATALLAVYAADSDVNHWLTVVGIIATTVATWAVPNLDPKAEHQQESVQPPSDTFGSEGPTYDVR